MLRTILITIKRAVVSPKFFVALGMVCIFRLLDILPTLAAGTVVQDGNVYYSYTVYSIYMVSGATMFELLSFMVPGIVYSGAFSEDLKSNHLLYAVMRISKTKYCVATVVTCALSAFFAAFFGEMLVTFVLSGRLEWYEAMEGVEENYRGILLSQFLMAGLRGAFFALASMLLSIFTINKFCIYSIPILVYFFFLNFGYTYLNVPVYFNISTIYTYYVFGLDSKIISILYTFGVTMVIAFLVARIMEKKIERCY